MGLNRYIAPPGFPENQGLYDSRNEHDACGIGFVANIKGRKSHAIVEQGLQVLVNLTHRGAVGADPKSGDGAGILIQIPDTFYREECAKLGFDLPDAGDYGVGMIFLPQDPARRKACEDAIAMYTAEEGQSLLGWRDVPLDVSDLGESVKENTPVIRQVFIGRGSNCADTDALERKLFVIRKQATRENDETSNSLGDFYVVSLSARTVVYKGLVLADQVAAFYPEIQDERVVSALALVHQRFSTNTFPAWRLAHPFQKDSRIPQVSITRWNCLCAVVIPFRMR